MLTFKIPVLENQRVLKYSELKLSRVCINSSSASLNKYTLLCNTYIYIYEKKNNNKISLNSCQQYIKETSNLFYF